MDVIISPVRAATTPTRSSRKLRGDRLVKGYWIDAASSAAHEATTRSSFSTRSTSDAIRKDGLARGVKNYIGGNCTVSLMLMALGGLFQRRYGGVGDLDDLSGRFGCWRAKHARADRGRWGRSTASVQPIAGRSGVGDSRNRPARWRKTMRSAVLPVKHFRGVPLAGSLIPWIDK
jgi:aspartate-semialdehyde dehydrogenase